MPSVQLQGGPVAGGCSSLGCPPSRALGRESPHW